MAISGPVARSFAGASELTLEQLRDAPVHWPRPSVLDASLKAIDGVGPRLAEAAAEAGISNVGDLLLRFPHSHRDRTIVPVSTLELGKQASIKVEVLADATRPFRRRGLSILTVKVGDDSGAVNGVCLTATAVESPGFETEAMNQTLSVTALGGVEAGGRVNLELAMKASDRLGGHIVQGHVDGVGEVASIEEDGFAKRLKVAAGARSAALRGRQGLDHARRGQPDDRRFGRFLAFRFPDTRDSGADEPRRGAAGTQDQRRV